MDYHIARNNQKLGVYPQAEVQTRYQSGEILPTDLVWCEGMPAWKPAAEVFVGHSPAPVPPPTPAAAPASATPPPSKPDNHLVWAILATLFCCMPFGIAAIVFAAQVDSKYSGGDYAGAQQSADRAKLWLWCAFGFGFFGLLVYLGLMFFGIAASGFPH